MAAGGPAWSCLKHDLGRAEFDPPQANFIFIHLYDYQMAFSPTCSAVYALGLVRLISRCCAVPQCSSSIGQSSRGYAHQSLSARARFVDPVRIFLRPCLPLACITLFYWSSLGHCDNIPFSYIRIPSSPCYRASFLTNNTSGISCSFHSTCF